MDSAPTKKRLDPTDNKLQLSSRQNPRTCVFLAKIFLKKFNNVELHALGESTKLAVRVAENLQRQGLVSIDKIHSFTHQGEEGRKVKLVVLLSLTEEGKKRISTQIQ